ncbi:DoxX family protein [Methylobacterium sp. J-078]|uniref:DoxX family protein n=1 Tax=Methylobacterium sp. J-078 TaxID=2836657 RepID=UPI001FBAFCB3|nr:DoxX family protein [Methylobacterium sp. J-078]MCJ2046130.1 DoxX family protein [Methylobacterium sp. J-078]
MRAPRFWWRLPLMAAYGFIGIVHLAAPDAFLPIMPAWVPEPRLTVIATGLCELAGVVGLAFAPTRRWAGIGLALYAVCVFPANLKHALEGIVVPGLPDSWWYHGPRLAFQPVFVWWALYAGGVIDWPFRRRPAGPPEISPSPKP